MIDQKDFTSVFEALLPDILHAGRVAMQHFETGVKATQKSDQSPVTAADHAIEEILLAALERVAGGIPVIAEEAVAAGRSPPVQDDVFLVDPIDGTRGFIRGRKEFTINIGYAAGGLARFGVIYAPALDRLYATLGDRTAIEAVTTKRTDARTLAGLDHTRIQTRSIRQNDLTVVRNRTEDRALERVLERIGAKPLTSSSSIKFCMVARGDGDFYPRLTEINEWDTAAGAAILRAAGGAMLGLDGAPSRFGKQAEKFRNRPFVAWSMPEPPKELLAYFANCAAQP